MDRNLPEEEKLLISRLFAKETQLKRTSKKFLSFANGLLLQSSSLEECIELYDGLVKELEMLELSNLSKPLVQSDANDMQLETYEHMISQRELEILEIQKSNEQLKQILAQEKVNRRNREEYAKLSSLINEIPSREEIQSEISKLKEELKILDQEIANCTVKLDDRTQQFQSLFGELTQLDQLFSVENSEVTQGMTAMEVEPNFTDRSSTTVAPPSMPMSITTMTTTTLSLSSSESSGVL